MAQKKLLKKMSLKTLLDPKPGFLAGLVPAPGDSVMLVRIAGIVRKCIQGTSQFGEYQEFTGEFQGTVLGGDLAGQVSMSGKCFLPSPVDHLLKEALDSGDGGAVEFVFDIGVKHLPAKGNDTASGYEYIVETVTETKVSDPLAALLASVEAPRLAAPAAAEAGADADKGTKEDAKAAVGGKGSKGK